MSIVRDFELLEREVLARYLGRRPDAIWLPEEEEVAR